MERMQGGIEGALWDTPEPLELAALSRTLASTKARSPQSTASRRADVAVESRPRSVSTCGLCQTIQRVSRPTHVAGTVCEAEKIARAPLRSRRRSCAAGQPPTPSAGPLALSRASALGRVQRSERRGRPYALHAPNQIQPRAQPRLSFVRYKRLPDLACQYPIIAHRLSPQRRVIEDAVRASVV